MRGYKDEERKKDIEDQNGTDNFSGFLQAINFFMMHQDYESFSDNLVSLHNELSKIGKDSLTNDEIGDQLDSNDLVFVIMEAIEKRNTKTDQAILVCIIVFQQMRCFFDNENINEEVVSYSLSLVADHQDYAFKALRILLDQRKHLFTLLDIHLLKELVVSNISNEAILFLLSFVKNIKKGAVEFFPVFNECFAMYPFPSSDGLFYSIKQNHSLADQFVVSQLFNDIVYVPEFIHLLEISVRYANHDLQETIISNIDWSKICPDIIGYIAKHCPSHINLMKEKNVFVFLFQTAVSGTFNERKIALTRICEIIDWGADLEEDFLPIAINSLTEFEGDILIHIIGAVSQIIVRANETIPFVLELMNSAICYIDNFLFDDNPEIKNAAYGLLSIIEDRKTELEI